ncbi:MAG: tetratricopeptide repeat protein [Burkholderiaceae bacterium]|nr:tetratricopeptide repeat protein [Burkholderiaceae bacterium]
MAKHFDLEEQEQLDQLKHFWARYGLAITWLLILVLGAFAAWNGYQFWERRQSGQASALYDEVERAAQSGDVALLERAGADIRDKYRRTTYASQAALLEARVLDEKQKPDGARAALSWLIDNGADDGYKAVARLRLAALLLDTKAYDEALKALSATVPPAFQPLVADRRGDVLLSQGKREEARAEFQRAHSQLEAGSDLRHLVEIKLNALGVDPATLAGKAQAGTPEKAK